jgi:hypothetical protein
MAAPAKPTINTLPLAENTRLSFSWTNEAGVDGYYIYDAPSTLLQSISGSANLTTVTGLTNGQTYNCYIHASNTNGVSEPAFFRPFQPGLAPSVAPISAVATKVGANSASIEWTPSGESLTAPIQWYTVQAVSADPAVSTFRYSTDGLKPVTSLFVTGLNNYSYQFAVQGVNCPGYSPPRYTSSIDITQVGGSWEVPQSFATKELTTTGGPVWSPGSGSFTWECFVYFTSLGPNNSIDWAFGNNGVLNSQTIRLIQNTASFSFYFQLAGSALNDLTYSSALTLSNWYHFAISKDSSASLTALWINGVQEDNFVDVNTYSGFNPLIFSAQSDAGSGYLTNLNFITGAFKYDPANSNITVPTSPVTSNVNTAALFLATNASNVFTDSGPVGVVVDTTNANGIAWSSNTPF